METVNRTPLQIWMDSNGTNLDEIREDFFATGDKCKESIRDSKAFIVVMCSKSKTSVADFVAEQGEEIDNDTNFTNYQKGMIKASMLLAWEELEKEDLNLVARLSGH